MATKSILKNINIKKRSNVRDLVSALEHAEQHRGKEIVMSRPVNEARGSLVKTFLLNYK